MGNQEKEVKILLNQDEYDKLKQKYQWKKCFTQINHYYGEKDFINRKGCCIRIREKSGKKKLQVKLPVDTQGTLRIRMEYEKEIDSVKEKLNHIEIGELCNSDFNDDCYYQGYLKTERLVCTEYEGCEICLDKNMYLGKVDYEVEIEFIGEYPQNIIEEIQKMSINTTKYTCGKYGRFLMEKNLSWRNGNAKHRCKNT